MSSLLACIASLGDDPWSQAPLLMSTLKKVHRDPLPAARPFNKTGIKLSPRVMRAVRRGVAQINRGEGIEFTSGAEAAAYLRKQARKA